MTKKTKTAVSAMSSKYSRKRLLSFVLLVCVHVAHGRVKGYIKGKPRRHQEGSNVLP
ncbi:MAG: hypothetical protein M0C28_42815 [Candidatus Moduliflexus flocculans]|nr:hypothetical protein [Candidatus Moduliflexus flocculans]